jgi:hypothetical protein
MLDKPLSSRQGNTHVKQVPIDIEVAVKVVGLLIASNIASYAVLTKQFLAEPQTRFLQFNIRHHGGFSRRPPLAHAPS